MTYKTPQQSQWRGGHTIFTRITKINKIIQRIYPELKWVKVRAPVKGTPSPESVSGFIIPFILDSITH